jgi:hypothetical protein
MLNKNVILCIWYSQQFKYFLLSFHLCSTSGRCKHLTPGYCLHSHSSPEQLNHVPSARFRNKRGSRFVVRAEAVSYSLFFLFPCYFSKCPHLIWLKISNYRISILYLVSQEMLVNLKSRGVSIFCLPSHAVIPCWFCICHLSCNLPY